MQKNFSTLLRTFISISNYPMIDSIMTIELIQGIKIWLNALKCRLVAAQKKVKPIGFLLGS